MSDTPRTDASQDDLLYADTYTAWLQMSQLARKLERELNQAIKERDEWMLKAAKAIRQHDDALKDVESNKAGWDRASLVALRLERERNEARECLREKLFDCVANQKSLTGYEPASPATVYLEPRSITETGKV